MRLIIIVLLIAIMSGCNNQTDVEGFKEFKFGMSQQELESLSFTCKENVNFQDVISCEKEFYNRKRYPPSADFYSIAGVPVIDIRISLYSNSVFRIDVTFPVNKLQNVLDAIQEKYGESIPAGELLEIKNVFIYIYKRKISNKVIVIRKENPKLSEIRGYKDPIAVAEFYDDTVADRVFIRSNRKKPKTISDDL